MVRSAYAYSPQTSLCGIPLGYVVVIDVAAFGKLKGQSDKRNDFSRSIEPF